MPGKYTYVKFLTNVPETVTFKFDSPKEFDGKFGKQYNYAVEWKGSDAYMSTTERLNDILQEVRIECGALQGVTLQILKYEDGPTKLWKIMDTRGNDLTPEDKGPKARQTQNSGSPQGVSPSQGGNTAQREWALKVVAEIASIKERLDALEKLDWKEMRKDIDGLVGALITPENEKAFELHKATTQPIREELAKNGNEAGPTGPGYDDIPTV